MKVYVVACVLIDIESYAYNEIESVMSVTFSNLSDAQKYLKELADKYEDENSNRVESSVKEGVSRIELFDEESKATYFHATIIETEVDEFKK